MVGLWLSPPWQVLVNGPSSTFALNTSAPPPRRRRSMKPDGYHPILPLPPSPPPVTCCFVLIFMSYLARHITQGSGVRHVESIKTNCVGFSYVTQWGLSRYWSFTSSFRSTQFWGGALSLEQKLSVDCCNIFKLTNFDNLIIGTYLAPLNLNW